MALTDFTFQSLIERALKAELAKLATANERLREALLDLADATDDVGVKHFDHDSLPPCVLKMQAATNKARTLLQLDDPDQTTAMLRNAFDLILIQSTNLGGATIAHVTEKLLVAVQGQSPVPQPKEDRTAPPEGFRILAGKGGKGFAYAPGREYPYTGFATAEEAIAAAWDHYDKRTPAIPQPKPVRQDYT